MTLTLLGINHRTAPLEVRERLAIPQDGLADAVRTLARFPGVEEGLILSTCNRVEMLACNRPEADLRAFVREYFSVEPKTLQQHFYEYRERDAVRHLFRVAASLDSMVVGEPQILGQVKASYAVAREVGAVRSQLDALLQRAFTVAKRVRSETAIGNASISVASVAVDLAKKIFGDLGGRAVCLVGAGKMSDLAARHLLAQGAGRLYVANRTFERARQMAACFGGEAVPFERLYETAHRADIVITSTGSPEPIFRQEHGEAFMQRRRNRPMFFIDIAVPRDVDPDMNRVDGLFVYDVDDLQAVVAAHLEDRGQEASRAEALIAAEVARYEQKLLSLDVVPTIVSLQESLEAVRQSELLRARGRLGSLTPEQEAAIDAMTRAMMNKILHGPMTTLKSAARDADTATLHAARRLFLLDGKRKAGGEG